MALDFHNALGDRIAALAKIRWDVPAPRLVEAAVSAGEARVTDGGALAVTTGIYTGRSVKDKFLVKDVATESEVWWEKNQSIGSREFDALLNDMLAFVGGKELFGQHLRAGAHSKHAMLVNVYSETAWHALFIRNLLIVPDHHASAINDVTILHLPNFAADPARHGTNSHTAIVLDLSRRVVLICGTSYAGEIKKSVFSLFNYHAPKLGILPMHCSANIGEGGDVALFFGLSGTGKTTLSNHPSRLLIGDDEHGWADDGVFNLEGGCYAKTGHLSAEAEPQIFGAANRFGTVLENVVLDDHGRPDYDNLSLTENTRAAYSMEALPRVAPGGIGGTPSTVVFLTADAFGVMPPIARLTPDQAAFHFLSGYTAKVAGTERGVTEPTATFSACFGAPFMPLHPKVYGQLLENRIRQSGANVFLLNTGWVGGAYGVGRRIDIKTTRRLLDAALNGELNETPMRVEPLFGMEVPQDVSGVPPQVLDPRRAWNDPLAYDAAAERLKKLFADNYRKFEILD